MENITFLLQVYRDLYLGHNTPLARMYIGTYYGVWSHRVSDQERFILNVEEEIFAEGFPQESLDRFCEVIDDNPDQPILEGVVYDLI
ncbi:MAG: hypothetical protein ACO3EZ_19785 [Prochlorotrichaceae cyanobacterium]